MILEMRAPSPNPLRLDESLLKPGLRLAVGLSGGADSTALLRALSDRRSQMGLVLHVVHLHHGLRGAEADADLEFARNLAASLNLPFHEAHVDTTAEAERAGESIEEAARRLRYGWFRQLMASGEIDAVATAHTLDDQAETVLAKFLRGAWTEGFSAIHPTVDFPEGRILRPILATTRTEVEAYLNALGQPWREDSSNRETAYTRNRIRHELLPLLEGWNPRLREHLAQMAALARDEEAWWQAEIARLAPQMLLPGRAVRGGGRASGESSYSLDVVRLAALAPAVQRRLLRYAASLLGAAPDFASTETLRTLALAGRAGQKRELAQGLRAERTPRELRLTIEPGPPISGKTEAVPEYEVTVPGKVAAPAFGLQIQITAAPVTCPATSPAQALGRQALLRNWKAGDRVRLRYSSSPRKVKEVLERLKVTGTSRVLWPVLELDGRIVWMKGVELEPEQGIAVFASDLKIARP